MAETSRNNPIHVGDRVYPYGMGMYRTGTYPKGKHRHLRYRDAGGSLDGGGGGDI